MTGTDCTEPVCMPRRATEFHKGARLADFGKVKKKKEGRKAAVTVFGTVSPEGRLRQCALQICCGSSKQREAKGEGKVLH